VSIFIDTMPT